MVHNPVVKIAAAKSEPRFAQDPGVAQALLTVRQVSSSEAEQLCQWGCTPFTSLKSHDRKVDRAATHVNHQQFGARAQTGAKGGGRDEQAVRAGILHADPDATYCKTFDLDLGAIAPMVATPGDPRNGIPLADLDGPVGIEIAYGGSCTGGKKADMVVNDTMASREHARIECRRGKFILTDMSTNGTYVLTAEGPSYLRREDIVLVGEGKIALGREISEATEIVTFTATA